MKCTYINHIPLAMGELSVVMSDNAVHTAQQASRLATELQALGMNVLLINCGMTSRRFAEYAPKSTMFFHYDMEENRDVLTPNPESGKAVGAMLTLDSVRGCLVNLAEAISQMIDRCRIDAIVIADWQWSSSSWRRREKLMYQIREMMSLQNVSFVIFAQAKTTPVAGTFDRGGIGRLAELAFAIADIRGTALAEKMSPPIPPLVVSPEDWAAAERSAQLLTNEINGIQTAEFEYAPHWDGSRGSGGSPMGLVTGEEFDAVERKRWRRQEMKEKLKTMTRTEVLRSEIVDEG